MASKLNAGPMLTHVPLIEVTECCVTQTLSKIHNLSHLIESIKSILNTEYKYVT